MKTALQPRNSLKWLFLTIISILVTITASAQSVQEEWSRRYGGHLPSQESSVQLAVDSEGNSYLAGNSQSDDIGQHVFLVKYSPTGEELWSQRLHDNSGATLSDIAVDAEGNVYTASIVFTGANYIGMLVKHSALDGTTLWEEVLSDGRNVGNVQIIADNTGDVFVSVYANQLFLGATTLVKKFNSQDGTLLWEKDLLALSVAEIAYPADFRFTSIALDSEGDAYITGTVETVTVPMQVSTLKLSGDDGSLVWNKKLHSPALRRVVTQIAVDNAGGAYIAGFSYTTDFFNPEGVFVVKYQASDGEQVWLQERSISNPDSDAPVLTDLKTDNIGGVYIATNAGDASQVIKHNAISGEVIWSAGFPGTIVSLALDETDGVYAAGNEASADAYIIRKYNANTGQVQWNQTGSGNSSNRVALAEMVLSEPGDLILAGLDTKIFISRHQTSDGANLWTIVGSGEDATSDTPIDNAVDEEGNIYVTGVSGDISGFMRDGIQRAIVTIKYSPQGEEMWVSSYPLDNSTNSGVGVSKIVVDKSGGVYITGRSAGDFLTIKYSASNGELIWDAYHDTGSVGDFAADIAVDNAGGVYITGFNPGASAKVATIKYNALDGSEVWVSNFARGGSTTNVSVSNGFVYVAARSYIARPNGSSDFDMVLIKYKAADGEEVMVSFFNSGRSDYPVAMGLDANDGVYLLGESEAGFSSLLPVLVKFSAVTGENLWSSNTENGIRVGGLAVDNAGEVFVGGYRGENTVLIKFDLFGTQAWIKEEAAGNIMSPKQSVAVDGVGGVFIASTVSGGFKTSKFKTSDGSLQWEILKEANTNYIYGPSPQLTLAIDTNHNILVTGFDINEDFQDLDFLTVKYSQQEDPCNVPVEVNLYLPPVAKRVGWQVRTTADFGNHILNEDTGVRWTWGDGSEPTISYTAFGTSRVTGEHTYQQAGIYQIGLDFTESCLKPTNSGYEQWMPVFDPEAGFVTGAGQATALGQRLGFNFSLGYSGKFAVEPRGHTHLLIQALGMFRSRSLEWLVVSGDKAAWKGEGVIDGRGRYGFIASVTDAGNPGADDTGDRLRVKVWDMERGNRVVYDSFADGQEILDLANQGPTIDRGNIVIHGNSRSGIQASAGSKALAIGQGLIAYPSTFSDRANISFTLDQAQDYTLEIYDTRGRLVKQLAAGRAEANTAYEHELNAAGLNEGLYIARLVTATGQQSIKLLLKR